MPSKTKPKKRPRKNSPSGNAKAHFLAKIASECDDTSEFASRVAEHVLGAHPEDQDDGPVARAYFGLFDTFELFGLDFAQSQKVLEFLESLAAPESSLAADQLRKLKTDSFAAAAVAHAIFTLTELTSQERRIICENTGRLLVLLPGTPSALRPQVIAHVLERGIAS